MKLELAVCDTDPLLYLTLIEELEILTKFFARILLPATVREELIHPKAPTVVRQVLALLRRGCVFSQSIPGTRQGFSWLKLMRSI